MAKEWLSSEQLARQKTIHGVQDHINRLIPEATPETCGFRIGSAANGEKVTFAFFPTREGDNIMINHTSSGLFMGDNGPEIKTALTGFELAEKITPLTRMKAVMRGRSTLTLSLRGNPASEAAAQALLDKFEKIEPHDRYITDQITEGDGNIRKQIIEDTDHLFATTDQIPGYPFRYDKGDHSILGLRMDQEADLFFSQHNTNKDITIALQTKGSKTQYISKAGEPLIVNFSPVHTTNPAQFANYEQTREALAYLQRGLMRVMVERDRSR